MRTATTSCASTPPTTPNDDAATTGPSSRRGRTDQPRRKARSDGRPQEADSEALRAEYRSSGPALPARSGNRPQRADFRLWRHRGTEARSRTLTRRRVDVRLETGDAACEDGQEAIRATCLRAAGWGGCSRAGFLERQFEGRVGIRTSGEFFRCSPQCVSGFLSAFTFCLRFGSLSGELGVWAASNACWASSMAASDLPRGASVCGRLVNRVHARTRGGIAARDETDRLDDQVGCLALAGSRLA